MQQTLDVNIENKTKKTYKIAISDNDLTTLTDEINRITKGKKQLFVISNKVYKLYSDVLKLDSKNCIVLPDGEWQKNLKNYAKILEKAVNLGLSRGDVFVAIGGGVIGDITGLAASTYMRGIDYIQVPTTLLSMLDSSVGGKTAIDLPNGKNVIGSFWQPRAVLININFLKTLDKKQYMSGLAEMLKYAFIEENCGYGQQLYLFEYLTLCCEKLFEKEPHTLIRVIQNCLSLKIEVVKQDEKETGLRKILNFGHTLAHAIEAKTKYKKYTHGQAVVYGMFFVLNVAYKRNLITYSYYRLSMDLISRYCFKNINIEKTFDTDSLVELMKRDKKSKHDKIVFILPVDKRKVEEFCFDVQEVKEMFKL